MLQITFNWSRLKPGLSLIQSSFCLSKENCQNTKLGHQKWYFSVDDTVLLLSVGAVYLLTKSLQAVQKTRPEVLEKWPVDLLQAVFGAGIHTDVKLSNWH